MIRLVIVVLRIAASSLLFRIHEAVEVGGNDRRVREKREGTGVTKFSIEKYLTIVNGEYIINIVFIRIKQQKMK